MVDANCDMMTEGFQLNKYDLHVSAQPYDLLQAEDTFSSFHINLPMK